MDQRQTNRLDQSYQISQRGRAGLPSSYEIENLTPTLLARSTDHKSCRLLLAVALVGLIFGCATTTPTLPEQLGP